MHSPPMVGRPEYTHMEHSMRTFIFAALVILPSPAVAQVRVTSPDGRNEVQVIAHEGRLYYAVQHDRRNIVSPSMLGFVFRGQPPLRDSLRISDSTRGTFDETWTRSEEHTSELQ